MKVSSKGRYALRLMIDLAQNSNGNWISLKDVSSRQNISIKYLEQIVVVLSKSGLLRSSRGSQGGYMLSKNPSEYTIGEIIRCVEGSFAPVACLEDKTNQCERQSTCPTIGFWNGLYDVINKYTDSYTLADLIPPQK